MALRASGFHLGALTTRCPHARVEAMEDHLTAVAIGSLVSERLDLKVAGFGFAAGVSLAMVGVLVLPPRKKGEEEEGSS